MGSPKNQYPQLNIKKLKKNIYKLDPAFFDDFDEDFGDEPDFDPRINPSKKTTTAKTIKILVACVILSFVGIFGFLLYKEYTAKGINGPDFGYVKPIPDFQTYDNDNFGFTVQYPGTWTRLSGSNNESNGGIFFGSSNADFKEELGPGEALVQILPQVSQGIGFEAWLIQQENDFYNPGEIISKTPVTVDNLQAKRYIIQLKNPPLKVGGYVDMYVVNKDSQYYFKILLQTSDQQTHDKYWPIFQNMLHSLVFYHGTLEK